MRVVLRGLYQGLLVPRDSCYRVSGWYRTNGCYRIIDTRYFTSTSPLHFSYRHESRFLLHGAEISRNLCLLWQSINSPRFVEPALYVQCWQHPASCRRPEPHKSSSHPPILFIKIHFNIIFYWRLDLPRYMYKFFPHQNLREFLFSLCVPHVPPIAFSLFDQPNSIVERYISRFRVYKKNTLYLS